MKSTRKELEQIPRLNVKSFPIQKSKSNESNSNHLQTDVNGYYKAMTMNDISKMQHSYENYSAVLTDQMINQATKIF